MKNKEQDIEIKLKELEKQLKFYKDIVDNTTYWKLFKDKTGRVLYVNKAHERITGYNGEDLINGIITEKDIIHPEDWEYVKNRLKAAEDNVVVDDLEFRIISKDKQIRHISLSAVPVFRDNAFVGISSSGIDITNRKSYSKSDRIRQALIDSEQKLANEAAYRLLMNQSRDGIVILDQTGRVYESNNKFADMLGYPHEYMDQLSVFDWEFLFPQKSLIEMLNIVDEKGAHFETKHRRKDGSIYDVEISTNAALFDGQKLIFCICRDITERKKVEEELRKSKEKAEESDRLKSTFLSNMSHEIRTPLNAILGFADLLTESKLPYESQLEYINIIQKSGKRLFDTVNDIIDISKIEAGLMEVDIEKVNINEQIEDIYAIFKPEAKEKGIKLSFKTGLPTHKAVIKTDSKMLYAIITNIVKNAIKFTKEGEIEFGYNIGNAVEAEHALSIQHLQFHVKDTGIGIPKDKHQSIFRYFVQADITNKKAYKGAGLGLSISKAYSDMLGGNIWVESEEGKGSTFYFSLPYNAERLEKSVIEDDLFKANSNNHYSDIKLKILIAEDEINSELFIKKLVSKYSRETLLARDGIEAVDICQKNPDIDLILMDIQMPEMNGYEATLQIRQFNKDVTIIAQTAFGFEDDRKKAIEAGCNYYISKPINRNKLYELIKIFFSK